MILLAERAKAVQESFEDRQIGTADALRELLAAINQDEKRKADQASKGMDGLSYFVLCKLSDDGFPQAEITSAKVRAAFAEFPDWRRSETAMRELRKKITFALFADEDDIDKVTATVEQLLTLVQKSFKQ